MQVDEIWQFVYAKSKNVPAKKRVQFGYGDVWTWVCFGCRQQLDPVLARRPAQHRWQQVLSHGGRRCFRAKIDCAMLQKVYGVDPKGDRRYSPPTVRGGVLGGNNRQP